MMIQEAINRLDAEFQETPLGFTVETALQARLLELLRAKVGETIQVHVATTRPMRQGKVSRPNSEATVHQ